MEKNVALRFDRVMVPWFYISLCLRLFWFWSHLFLLHIYSVLCFLCFTPWMYIVVALQLQFVFAFYSKQRCCPAACTIPVHAFLSAFSRWIFVSVCVCVNNVEAMQKPTKSVPGLVSRVQIWSHIIYISHRLKSVETIPRNQREWSDGGQGRGNFSHRRPGCLYIVFLLRVIYVSVTSCKCIFLLLQTQSVLSLK